jgi:hypothetical protein
MINAELLRNYGTIEINPLPSKNYHDLDRKTISWYSLTKSDKITATRLRLLTSPNYPWFDVSYFHLTVNGEHVEIRDIPIDKLGRKTYKSELIQACKDQGIFVKDITSDFIISKLY